MTDIIPVSDRAREAAAKHFGFVHWADLLSWGPRQAHTDLAEAFARFESSLSSDKERLIEALDDAEAVQIGPNGRGGMRVVVHFPKPGSEGRLFAILSDALQDHQS